MAAVGSAVICGGRAKITDAVQNYKIILSVNVVTGQDSGHYI